MPKNRNLKNETDNSIKGISIVMGINSCSGKRAEELAASFFCKKKYQ
jgi:hypothetical protein